MLRHTLILLFTHPLRSTAHHSAPPPRCDVCPLLAENLELRQQAGYWKSMHQRACTRISELQAEVELLRPRLRLRERQLFGRKAEPAPASPTRLAYRPPCLRTATSLRSTTWSAQSATP